MITRPTTNRGRIGIGVTLLVIVAAGAGVLIALSASGDGRSSTREAVELDDGFLGTRGSVQLTTAATLPPVDPSGIQDPGRDEDEPNEEMPRTPTDPSAPFISSADMAAAPLGADLGAAHRTSFGRGYASLLAEPSIAANGDRVLVTWNKPTERDGRLVTHPGGGAAFSNDGGRTFSYVDPERQPWGEVHGGFCCDQRVLYSPKHDLWIWTLLYWPDATGNVLRIAVARGNDGFDKRRFSFVDLTADSFAPIESRWTGYWLDYPNVGLTDDHFFVSANVYPPNAGLDSAVVVRMPLANLASGGPPAEYLTFRRFAPDSSVPDDGENLTSVFASGVGSTMYFAQQITDAKLRVWSWPDDQSEATSVDVEHSRYLHGSFPPSCARAGAPPNSDWCRRSDDRLQSAWVTGGTIGFAWNAQQDFDHGFPYPFVMVVRVDEKTKTLIDEPILWSDQHAYQYATLAPNTRGEVGGVVLGGGGSRYQTCAAIVLGTNGGTKPTWTARTVDASDSDPLRPKTGDYLGTVVAGPSSNEWDGSCMTLHGGGENSDVEVWFVRFSS